MNKRIELRAIVQREGRTLAFGTQGTPWRWELPGGAFDDAADDIDAAMDSLLRAAGIATPNTTEAFLRTDYHRDGDTQVVLNLYALTEWEGEPVAPLGAEIGWFAPEDIEALGFDDATRESLLVAFEMRPEPEPEFPAELMGTAPSAPRAPGDRRFAGLDVLRTLGATADPVASFERMTRTMPEIAADVVDFALGEVWATAPLDRKTRSLQVVAMLAALGGRGGPLRSHINGALNHGATPEQVVETLRMVAVYAGFPAALDAWPVMEEVFAARGVERPARESR